jgi:hypothetical protein
MDARQLHLNRECFAMIRSSQFQCDTIVMVNANLTPSAGRHFTVDMMASLSLIINPTAVSRC